MKLLNTKSMIRYLPPNGTAGLARSFVRGYSRVPLPPARTIPRTRMRIGFDQGLLWHRAKNRAGAWGRGGGRASPARRRLVSADFGPSPLPGLYGPAPDDRRRRGGLWQRAPDAGGPPESCSGTGS